MEYNKFFHIENKTFVEWNFKYKKLSGCEIFEFDGISIIEWSNNKIKFLKEFRCNVDNYNPYKNDENYKTYLIAIDKHKKKY